MLNTTIFYVDDDMGEVALMKIRLEAEGISVRSVHSIKNAIKEFDAKKYLLAIIDWNLLDGEGAIFARHIRRLHDNFPIIFLSGVFSEKKLTECEIYDPLACLEKDINAEYINQICALTLGLKE